jgi:hypothetical protein
MILVVMVITKLILSGNRAQGERIMAGQGIGKIAYISQKK